jgi:hypothetical protein
MSLSEGELRFVCFMRRKHGFCVCNLSEGKQSLAICVFLNWIGCLYVCLLNKEVLFCIFVFK